jgi:hypothetical protein
VQRLLRNGLFALLFVLVVPLVHALGGYAVYQENAVNNLRGDNWTGADFTAGEETLQDIGSEARFIDSAWSEKRNESIIVTHDILNDVNVVVLNMTSRATLATSEVTATAPSNTFRTAAVAYESVSGNGLIVWDNATADTKIPYMIWNSTALSATQALSSPTASSTNRWMLLKPRNGSNDIMMIYSTALSDFGAALWNGTDWESQMELTVDGAIPTYRRPFDFVWYPNGDGIVFYANGSSDINHRTFTYATKTWGNPQVTIDIGAIPQALDACKNPNNSYVGVITTDSSGDANAFMWNGSAVDAGSPTEDATIETAGHNSRCDWETGGQQAVFVFIDSNSLSVDYFHYNLSADLTSRNWSTATLGTTSNTGNIASDDIETLRLNPSPQDDTMVLLFKDLTNYNVFSAYWNGESFVTGMANNLLEPDSTGGSATPVPNAQSFDFIWNEFKSNQPVFTLNTTDSSNVTSPTNEGSNVTFLSNASDRDGNQWYLLVCSGREGEYHGNCYGTELCRSATVNSSLATSCQYNTSGLTNENYTWFSYACDNNTVCSRNNNLTAPFTVNHKPTTAPTLSNSSPAVTDTLTCAPAEADTDGGNTVSITYAWYIKNESAGSYSVISGQTANTLATNNYDSNDQIICESTPKDNFNFQGLAVNTTAATIRKGNLTATSGLNITRTFLESTALFVANCTMTTGDAESVTLIIQDNRTGTYTQSTTTPGPIYVNTSSISLGRLASTISTTHTVLIRAQTAGNYSFRAECQASDAAPSSATSVAESLTIDPYSMNASALVNGTAIDRDATNNTVADSVLLNITVPSYVPNGRSISFYANLTNPAIGGQTNILLGTNTTLGGSAGFWFNPTSSHYAGNYTWFGSNANGSVEQVRNVIVYGQLNSSYKNNTNPETSYFLNDTAAIAATIASFGPETINELSATYSISVNSLVNDGNQTASNPLSFSNPVWSSTHTLFNPLSIPGLWNATLSASGSYWYTNSTNRSFIVYSRMNITSNSTAPTSMDVRSITVTTCGVKDYFTNATVQGATVSFYQNGTLLGTNTTTSAGVTQYYINITAAGNHTIRCALSDQPEIYYYAGSVTDANMSVTVDALPRVLNVVNGSITMNSTTITWNTDKTTNGSVRYGTTTTLSGGSNSSTSFAVPHSLILYGLTDNTLYYYNITSCDTGAKCNTSGPHNFTTLTDGIAPTVTLVAPQNNSGSTNTTIEFTYTASDNIGISNCSLYFNNTLQQTEYGQIGGNFTVINLAPSTYNWSVTCIDSSNSHNSATTSRRLVSVVQALNYSGVTDLTNADIRNVSNFSIQTSQGNITFSQPVNLSGGANLDAHIIIGNGSIEVNSSVLSMLNVSARLRMFGLSYEFTPEIERDGVLCNDCSDLTYSSSTFSFNVTGFSNYTSRANSQLNVSDKTDTLVVYPERANIFYANYSRKSNNNPLTGAGVYCNFSENSGGSWSAEVNMTYNATSKLYEYYKTINTVGTSQFQTTCNGTSAGFELLTLSDNFTITLLSNPPTFNANVVDSSDATTPTSEAAFVTFSGTATDPNSDAWYLLLCDSAGTTIGACNGTQICSSGSVASNTQASCTHNTSGESSENYNWFAYACDANTVCSTVNSANSPYVVNHAPSVTGISLNPFAATVASTLSCAINTSDSDTGDTVNGDYVWYLQNEGAGSYAVIGGQTTSTLTNASFDSNDDIICEATPTDNHGFAGTRLNSTAKQIGQGTLSATSALYPTLIMANNSAFLNGSCTLTNGDAASVTLIVQDNRTGIYTQSTTTPGPIYVNASSLSLGALASTISNSQTVRITAESTGNYSFRVECQAADATPTTATSVPEAVTVEVPLETLHVQNTSITLTAGVFTWDTTKTANSTVQYGTTSALSTGTNSSSAYVFNHSIALYGLTENTLYYYNVSGCQATGECNTSGPYTFTTLADTTPPVITLIAPQNNSGITNQSATFNYTATDETGIANCTIYLNTTAYQTETSPLTGNFTLTVPVGTYNWSIGCTDSSQQQNSINQSGRVITSVEASNYFAITDLSTLDIRNVSNFSIQTALGNITFNGSINFSGGADLDANTIIGNGSVVVNSTALTMLNTNARVRMFGLSFPYTPTVQRDGVVCDDCTGKTYNGSELSFNVTGFSNYTAVNNSKLNISDDSDYGSAYIATGVRFYANYTNTEDDSDITGGNTFCNFTENSTGAWSTEVNMTYNATTAVYEYTNTYPAPVTFTYSITCDGSSVSREVLTLIDTATVRLLSNPPLFNFAVNDSSNSTIPTNHGANVTFLANATDPDADPWYLLICGTSGVTLGNCVSTEICRSSLSGQDQYATCQHNTTGEMNEEYNWSAYACDSLTACSDVNTTESPYNVNHKPSVDSVSISPTEPNASNTLSCAISLSDTDSGDIASAAYRWFIQNESIGSYTIIGGETTNTLAGVFDSNDGIICEGIPTDNHGFSGPALNSSAVRINQANTTAAGTLNSSTVLRTQQALFNVSCAAVNGDSENITITIQDNRTGTYTQSATTPASIYVNTSSIALGRLDSQTSTVHTVRIYTSAAGNYSFRALCGATDTDPTQATSTPTALSVILDTVPPTISSVNAVPTYTTAQITWTTDKISTSKIDYGTTTALDDSFIDPTTVLSHSSTLTGLTAATFYYYNVTSCNIDDYCATEGTYNFTTLTRPVTNANQRGYCTAVVVEEGPNHQDGYITKGDVVEFYCELPHSIEEREAFTIDWENKHKEVKKTVQSPAIIAEEGVVLYP